MLKWLKMQVYCFMSRRVGLHEPSVTVPGYVPPEWLADFVISRANQRRKKQRVCFLKTTRGDFWEIHDA